MANCRASSSPIPLDAPVTIAKGRFVVSFMSPPDVRVRVFSADGRLGAVMEQRAASGGWAPVPTHGLVAEGREILEVAIPFAALGVGPASRLGCFLSLHLNGVELERYPGHQALEIVVPSPEFEAYNWTA